MYFCLLIILIFSLLKCLMMTIFYLHFLCLHFSSIVNIHLTSLLLILNCIFYHITLFFIFLIFYKLSTFFRLLNLLNHFINHLNIFTIPDSIKIYFYLEDFNFSMNIHLKTYWPSFQSLSWSLPGFEVLLLQSILAKHSLNTTQEGKFNPLRKMNLQYLHAVEESNPLTISPAPNFARNCYWITI
jgi:hypothetical protein